MSRKFTYPLFSNRCNDCGNLRFIWKITICGVFSHSRERVPSGTAAIAGFLGSHGGACARDFPRCLAYLSLLQCFFLRASFVIVPWESSALISLFSPWGVRAFALHYSMVCIITHFVIALDETDQLLYIGRSNSTQEHTWISRFWCERFTCVLIPLYDEVKGKNTFFVYTIEPRYYNFEEIAVNNLLSLKMY